MAMTPALRWTTAADAPGLAALHAAAWRFAYAGIIPGLALERRIAAHGPAWWRRFHSGGERALAMEAAGALAGYSRIGPSRSRRGDGSGDGGGEIYELYLDPAHAGLGFGALLFREARRRLASRGHRGLIVWALAENQAGLSFYRALGGEEIGRSPVWVGDARLEQIGFVWR